MLHSGSRAMGQAILAHHLPPGKSLRPLRLQGLAADEGAGRAYLQDVTWARAYAAENRLAMLRAVADLLRQLCGAEAAWDTLVHSDHNHVQRECHDGRWLWVHRKGAQSACAGELGIVPGSMGSVSFHTAGRGSEEALSSCSHGAGRQLSRTAARQKIGRKELERQVGRVWFDHRRAERMRDEAPGAYKDLRQVMRAQSELAKVVRELRPVLNYRTP